MNFLWRGVLTGATFVLTAACGSNVTVEGAGGAGGSSGATITGTGASGSLVTAGSGTGSGTGTATGTATGTGTGTGTATGSGSGTGTGTASSGTGGGGPPSEACGKCAEAAIQGPCADKYNACTTNFACNQLLDCHSSCEWTSECNAMCDAIIPSGAPLLKSLMQCVICDSCKLLCAGSTVDKSYCP
jgi:hypothetical protein